MPDALRPAIRNDDPAIRRSPKAADVYLGRDRNFLNERRRIKEMTLNQRRLLNLEQAA